MYYSIKSNTIVARGSSIITTAIKSSIGDKSSSIAINTLIIPTINVIRLVNISMVADTLNVLGKVV